jgi:hypothetical protein
MAGMFPGRRWLIAPLTLVTVACVPGCGTSRPADSLTVGSDSNGSSGGPFTGAADAGDLGAFDAHIEENHMKITFVTVGCTGPCADVNAVAMGGFPPYSYAWSDGPTGPARRVCPTSNTSYHVKVSDTGTTGEFARSPESVDVSVGADVVACPDAGSTGTVGDAGPEPGFHWAHWVTPEPPGNPATATATILAPSGAIAVTYVGEIYMPILASQPTDYFVPASTYTCSTVGNRPTEADGLVLQQGGTTTVDTLTFSRPVTNPVFAIMSLGNSQLGANCIYAFGAFGETFTILQQGMGEMAGPGTLTDDDGGLRGDDGDGLVQLNGTFSSIKWTDGPAGCEGFGVHGFTVGSAGP